MTEIKREPFDHKGKKYEVVVYQVEDQLRARALLDGKPANKITATVDIFDSIDLKNVTGIDGLDQIIQYAKDSVTGAG